MVAVKINTKQLRETRLIERALEVLKRRLREPETRYEITSPGAAATYLRLKLAELDREVFMVVYLDARHRPIAMEELFRGTLTQTVVYPREIVRAALRHNAAAVVLAHNHPSGLAVFSEEDRLMTKRVREVLRLVDVKVLDHVLVAGASMTSLLLEEGLETLRKKGRRHGSS